MASQNPLLTYEKCVVTVPDEVLVRELDGESVLLNLENDQYYGLDEVGTRIFAVLRETGSVAETHHRIAEEFQVTPEQLAEDMAALLHSLSEQGLLSVRSA